MLNSVSFTGQIKNLKFSVSNLTNHYIIDNANEVSPGDFLKNEYKDSFWLVSNKEKLCQRMGGHQYQELPINDLLNKSGDNLLKVGHIDVSV